MASAYPTRRGHYTRRELSHLSTALGFPSTLFSQAFAASSNLQAEHGRLVSGRRVSEKAVIQLSDTKLLHQKLDKVFNKYPAKYNIKLIKKAMLLLRHRVLSFKEISDARVAFEVYTCEDGSGLPAELQVLTQALKMVERVMSHTRLDAEILKYQQCAEAPCRFQMYEFFDLVVMCEKAEEVQTEMDSSCSLEDSGSNADLALPDFEQILMTTDQKILKYLDDRYKTSLYKEVEPTPAVLDNEHIVDKRSRRSLVSLTKEQTRAISPSIEQSQSQLFRARSGYLVLNEQQHSAFSSRTGSPVRKETPARSHWRDPLRDFSREGGHTQIPLHVRFQRVPRQISHVTRDANSQTHEFRTLSEGSESHKLPYVINDGCVASVVRARDALKSSLATVPRRTVDETQNQDSTFCPPRHPPRGFKIHESLLHRLPRLHSHEPSDRSRRMHFDPVVSQQEKELQQGLMDDLEWRALRKEAVRMKEMSSTLSQ